MSKQSTLKEAVETLQDCHAEAQQCGQPVVDVLAGIVSSLQSTTRLANTAQRCLMLKEQADEAISTYPYSDVPESWRRLYMDATLLHVTAVLLDKCTLPVADLLELVRLLDMANIITGYFDKGRETILFSLLGLVQSELPPAEGTNYPEPPAKKQRRHGKSPTSTSPSPSATSTFLPGIDYIKTYTLDDAPGLTELLHTTDPFIVKRGISNWPAIASRQTHWSSSDYLLKTAGRGRIVPVEIGSSYTAEGWGQKMMDFEEFLGAIKWDKQQESRNKSKGNSVTGQEDEPILYLAQHDLFQQFPSLSGDILVPDYVFSDPGPPVYFPDYRPPNVPSGYTKNAWMGPKGTYSPAHTDPYYNCYAQVVGRKHIWVAPPQCSRILGGTSPENHSGDDSRNAAAQHFMDNTAQIDVFAASIKLENDEPTPQEVSFRSEVLPLARQAILEEGDLLYMPPKWWHSLKSLERSFSVSMWF